MSQIFSNRHSCKGKMACNVIGTTLLYPGIPSHAKTCLDFQGLVGFGWFGGKGGEGGGVV